MSFKTKQYFKVVRVNDKPVVLYCVYRSSSNNSLFIESLRSIFDDIQTDNKCTITIGDINIDIKGKVDNEYLDIMSANSFKSFINIFTRIPKYGSSSC